MEGSDDNLHPLSSPTNSSVSSSDFDTQSTGSFFREKSTTLGTLMGLRPRYRFSPNVSVPRPQRDVSPRVPNNPTRKKNRTPWWRRLCRDANDYERYGSTATNRSLRHFLQVERRSILDDYLRGGLLFVDGSMPPLSQPSISASSSSRRFSVFGIRTCKA